jgi:hypothetical protein
MYGDFYIGEEPLQIPNNEEKRVWYDKGTFELNKEKCKFELDLFDINPSKMSIEINYDYEKITLYERIQEIFGYKQDKKIRNKVMIIKFCYDFSISTTIDNNILTLDIFKHNLHSCRSLLAEKYMNIPNNIATLKIRQHLIDK